MLCHCRGDRGAAGPASSLSCRVQLIGISQRWSVLFMSPSRTGSAGPSQGTVPVLERCRRGCPGARARLGTLYLRCLSGLLPVTRRDQGNIFIPPLLHNLASVFLLLFFPPCFVDVGCGQGQVTGQDVLLLRRYRHVNKRHSFLELPRALQGENLHRRVVSLAPGTALPRLSHLDPLAWGLPRGSIPPKMSVSEVFDIWGLLALQQALGIFILHTQLHTSIFNPLRQLEAA